ncbi:MAG: HupE/UreJ family protein [Planctomycetes bacterium]|nr:HupE/UreJ family protein [Planctomycetota bacterium]
MQKLPTDPLRRRLAAAAVLTLVLSSVAEAHVGIGSTRGLAAGLQHPLGGIDHLCAMVAVGLWAGQRGGRSIWALPLAFIGVMTLGGMLGAAGLSLPFVERGILASLLVLGVLVAAAVRLPTLAGAFVVGVFALFHGHAHGTEMPHSADGLVYGAGFVIATAALHALGVGMALGLNRYTHAGLVRVAGAAVALCGLALLLRS